MSLFAATRNTHLARWGSLHASILIILAALTAACDGSTLSPVTGVLESTVTDLRATGSTTSSVSLAFTEVDDGTGSPAYYRVRYATTSSNALWPGEYTTITGGACAIPARGAQVGATFTCEVPGLQSGTSYDFRLIPYHYDRDGVRVFGEPSNIATAETAEGTSSPRASGDGIWISRDELMQRPTSGIAWDRVLSDAGRDPGRANIADMSSNHDVYTLAAALTCIRTNQHCAKARRGVLDAIGTEDSGRWLEVGRNLSSYVIAADLLNLREDGNPGSDGTRVQKWIEGWLTKQLPDNTTRQPRGFQPFRWGANASAQEGFAYTAVAAYLQDDWALQRAWDAFRTFACDPGAPDRENMDLVRVVNDGWVHDDLNPCAINPEGTVKRVPSGVPGAGEVRRIDGSLGGDMRRGGTYRWDPGYTHYPWVGLEGLVPAAVILHRAGYPAFEVADRAVLRTHEYLWFLRVETGDERWFDGIRAREVIHLVNVMYGTSFPINRVIGQGRTMGYTGWTHSAR